MSLPGTECQCNFPCKTVPFYNVSWCMLHMDESLLSLLSHLTNNSLFQLPTRELQLFSGDCSRNCQSCEDTWKSISWKSFHILYLFISISCSYLSRRVVPSINIPMLLSKQRLLIIRIETPLFNCVLTKPERDLYPFALVFSFVEITEVAASPAPNLCSWSIDFRLRRLVSLRVWLGESLVQAAV